jgi:streptomycin 6-kinase
MTSVPDLVFPLWTNTATQHGGNFIDWRQNKECVASLSRIKAILMIDRVTRCVLWKKSPKM